MHTPLFDKCLIRLSVTEGIFNIRTDEIIRMKASGNYTIIHFTGRKPLLIAKVLKDFEEMLSGYGFIRTHRAHLVNSRYVNRINNKTQILMTDSSVAAISRRMKVSVMQQLKISA